VDKVRHRKSLPDDMGKETKKAFVIFAAEIDDLDTDFDVYAVAESQEIADKIIKSDSENGQIHPNAFVQKFRLYQNLNEVE
jgi:hypothetical protein